MRLAFLLVAIALGMPIAVSAQGSVTVPVDDPLYRDVDRLIDAGLATHVVVGMRPYSRRMIARIARDARSSSDSSRAHGNVGQSLAELAIRRLLAAFPAEVADLDGAPRSDGVEHWTPLRSLRLDGLATDAPTRAVPSNGLGAVEASLNTLTDHREGRRLLPGANLALESEHAVQLLPGVSLQARPRVWAFRGRTDHGSGVSGELLAASLRAVRSNVSLTAGREYTEWALAEGMGLFFSDNAPALDMVRIASDAPFSLPWVLGRLGQVAGTVQVADLGRSDSNSHSRLVSYKVSVKPTEALEVGATFDNHFGGAGARATSAFDRFIDLVPFLDIFRHHIDSTAVDSDKLLGVDGRLRLSQLGNVTLFGELAIEDFDFHRLHSIFTEDAAYTTGIIVPALFSPWLSARAGYHTVGLRFYEHHILRNGIAARRFTLGDALGHDANGFFALIRSERGDGVSVTAEAAYEVRRNDAYVGTYTRPGLAGFVFTRLAVVPSESRTRGVVSARWFRPDGGLMVELRAGAERSGNFAFVGAPPQTHGLASGIVAWYH